MKKLTWPALIFFSLAAVLTRFLHLRAGYDAQGLPVDGAAACVLPILLIAAAAFFFLSARSYPAQRELCGSMEEYFDFSRTLSVTLSVLGAFVLIAAAALSVILPLRTTLSVLLAVFWFASGASVIYVLFSLRRGSEPVGVVVLTPVYALVLQLIFAYRASAADPILDHSYLEILAISALTAAFLEFAAFVFRNGAARIFAPLAAISFLLCCCCMADRNDLLTSLFFLGFALILLGYGTAADFVRK